MKKIAWILVSLALLVLFPGLPQTLAAIAADAAVWASSDRFLVGLAFGLIALPHLRRTTYRTTKH